MEGGDWGFNSTMVRLKEAKINECERRIKFQFHYGSIKGSLCIMEGGDWGFNSTMVRLKEAKINECERRIKFQFHYGSIKGNTRNDKRRI